VLLHDRCVPYQLPRFSKATGMAVRLEVAHYPPSSEAFAQERLILIPVAPFSGFILALGIPG